MPKTEIQLVFGDSGGAVLVYDEHKQLYQLGAGTGLIDFEAHTKWGSYERMLSVIIQCVNRAKKTGKPGVAENLEGALEALIEHNRGARVIH